jgi:hypothetical protein
MFPGPLQYQGKLKERVDVLFVWMELHQFTFHHLEKMVFMQYCRFFERKHKYRKMKRHFDNTVEKDSARKRYTRKPLFDIVKNIQVVFGKVTVKG